MWLNKVLVEAKQVLDEGYESKQTEIGHVVMGAPKP